MSESARRASALAVHLRAARDERDREAAGRLAALNRVAQLEAEVVHLHARVQLLEETAAAQGPRLGKKRGLASLIGDVPSEAGAAG